MFDEPSSYLDVKQRLNAAITIRSLITPDRWAAPPHLLPILNKKTQRCTFHYNSKYFSGTSLWWSTTWVCWITSPTSSAVCTVCQVPTVWSLCRSASEKVSPFGPDVNLRCCGGGGGARTSSCIRDSFQVSTSSWMVMSPPRTSGSVRRRWCSKWQRRQMRRRWRDWDTTRWVTSSTSSCLPCSLFLTQCALFLQYPDMCKMMGEFTLEIRGGEFTDSEIMVMLGENGMCSVWHQHFQLCAKHSCQ